MSIFWTTGARWINWNFSYCTTDIKKTVPLATSLLTATFPSPPTTSSFSFSSNSYHSLFIPTLSSSWQEPLNTSKSDFHFKSEEIVQPKMLFRLLISLKWITLFAKLKLYNRRCFRGTQRQFSGKYLLEDDLSTRIFGTFVVKFLAYLPLLGFSNIYKMV